jgi:hypothetical protein
VLGYQSILFGPHIWFMLRNASIITDLKKYDIILQIVVLRFKRLN